MSWYDLDPLPQNPYLRIILLSVTLYHLHFARSSIGISKCEQRDLEWVSVMFIDPELDLDQCLASSIAIELIR